MEFHRKVAQPLTPLRSLLSGNSMLWEFQNSSWSAIYKMYSLLYQAKQNISKQRKVNVNI